VPCYLSLLPWPYKTTVAPSHIFFSHTFSFLTDTGFAHLQWMTQQRTLGVLTIMALSASLSTSRPSWKKMAHRWSSLMRLHSKSTCTEREESSRMPGWVMWTCLFSLLPSALLSPYDSAQPMAAADFSGNIEGRHPALSILLRCY